MIRKQPKKQLLHLLPTAALSLILAGCGGQNSDSPNPLPNNVSTTTVSGNAIAGAVNGALTVTTPAGVTLATAVVTAGAFTIDLPDSALSGELDFVVTGSYVDEVSGGAVTLSAGNPLALRVAANQFQPGQGGNAPITPDTTIIRALAENHGMALADAKSAFQNALGYQPDMGASPFDPAATDSATATGRAQADKDASFRAGMFSQLASDLGLTGDNIAALPAALASDLGDGDLDGVGGAGNPVTIGAINLATLDRESALPFRLLKAHAGFAGNGAANHAALTAPAMGLPSVSYDAQGTEKSVTTAKGRTLRVKLDTVADTPFKPGFWTARVRHRLTVTDAGTGLPVDITTDPDVVGVSNHPMMYMLNGHDHTTPHVHAPDTSGRAAGQYLLDSYYVMASAMGNGMPMGVWDYLFYIKEDTNGDRATAEATTPVIFHPQVKMTMGGDLLSASASNAADQWSNLMGMTQARPYRVWLHEVKSNVGGGHDLTLFISTQNVANQAMGAAHAHALSFPAVFVTQVLQGAKDAITGMAPDITLNSVSVEVSLDGATWNTLTADGATGRYTVTALAGLSSSLSNTLQVRLMVNGNEMKSAANAYPELKFIAP